MNTRLIGLASLFWLALSAFGQPVPAFTAYTWLFQTNATAAQARAYLGVGTGGGSTNWVDTGSTNSSLAGDAYAHSGHFTNSLTLNGVNVLTNSVGGSTNQTSVGTNDFWQGGISADNGKFTNNLTFPGTNTAGLILRNLTTAQLANLPTPPSGAMAFNTDSNRFMAWDGSAWHQRVRLDGDTMYGALAILTLTPTNNLVGIGNGSTLVPATKGMVTNAFGLDGDTTKFINGAGNEAVPTAAGTAGGGLAGSYPNPYLAAPRDIRLDGAVGDGSTDNSTAIANSLAASSTLFIPPGNFSVPSGIALTANTTIIGTGTNSILSLPLASPGQASGYLLDAKTYVLTVRNVTFNGNAITNLNQQYAGTRSAINLYAVGHPVVENCTFNGWSSNAVFVSGDGNNNTRLNHAVVRNSYFTNCYFGVHLDDNFKSEYSLVEGNYIRGCYYGLEVDSANCTIVGNELTDNSWGWRSYPAVTGKAHSLYVGNTVNHSKIRFYNLTSGANVIGNDFLGQTQIELYSPTIGVRIANNFLENNTVSDFSGGTNVIEHNSYITAINPSGSSTSLYRRNWNVDTGQDRAEPVTLTDAATIATDCNKGRYFRVTVTASRTLGVPTHPVDGISCTWEIIQDAVGTWATALDTVFVFPTNNFSAYTANTNANTRDMIWATYNSAKAKWLITDIKQGF